MNLLNLLICCLGLPFINPSEENRVLCYAWKEEGGVEQPRGEEKFQQQEKEWLQRKDERQGKEWDDNCNIKRKKKKETVK